MHIMENETERYKGYKIEVFIEEYVHESPRDWANVGVMLCSHKRYTLGDNHHNQHELPTNPEAIQEHVDEVREDGGLVLPLSLYDHSGITMSVGVRRGWDSGVVGFIYAPPEAVEEHGEEKAEEILRAEVDVYDDYIRGDVFGFRITDPEGEIIDSCGGFFGLDSINDHIKPEAKSIIDSVIKRRQERRNERVKAMIQNGVPLNKRPEVLASYAA